MTDMAFVTIHRWMCGRTFPHPTEREERGEEDPLAYRCSVLSEKRSTFHTLGQKLNPGERVDTLDDSVTLGAGGKVVGESQVNRMGTGAIKKRGVLNDFQNNGNEPAKWGG